MIHGPLEFFFILYSGLYAEDDVALNFQYLLRKEIMHVNIYLLDEEFYNSLYALSVLSFTYMFIYAPAMASLSSQFDWIWSHLGDTLL